MHSIISTSAETQLAIWRILLAASSLENVNINEQYIFAFKQTLTVNPHTSQKLTVYYVTNII